MANEEIKPEGAEAVNPPAAEGVNSAQAEGGTPQGTEPNAAPKESSYTPEQIAAMQKQAALYEEAQKEITRQQQMTAEYRRALEQRDQALMSLMGQQNRAADPLAAAEAEYAEARNRFDTNAELAALRKMRSLEAESMRREAQKAAIEATQVQRGIEAAQQYGVTDPTELVEVQRTLTPADLAIIAASRKGKLKEILDRRQTEEEKRARDAANLDSILRSAGEIGGGRRVPGSLAANAQGELEVPASLYYAVPLATAKKKWPNAKVVAG